MTIAASAHEGAKPSWPRDTSPASSGWMPSMSLCGSSAPIARRMSRWAGKGCWMMTPPIDGSALRSASTARSCARSVDTSSRTGVAKDPDPFRRTDDLAHIDARGRVVADHDDGDARDAPDDGRLVGELARDAVEHRVRHRATVEDPGTTVDGRDPPCVHRGVARPLTRLQGVEADPYAVAPAFEPSPSGSDGGVGPSPRAHRRRTRCQRPTPG